MKNWQLILMILLQHDGFQQIIMIVETNEEINLYFSIF